MAEVQQLQRVGWARVEWRFFSHLDAQRWTIGALYVEPTWRRLGVGTALVAHVRGCTRASPAISRRSAFTPSRRPRGSGFTTQPAQERATIGSVGRNNVG